MNRTQYRAALEIVARFIAGNGIVVKASDDLAGIVANYSLAFSGAVAAFLISHREKQTLKEELRNSIGVFLALAFMAGYQKGSGGSGDVDPEDQAWLDSRIALEMGFVAGFVDRVAAMDTEGKSEAELQTLADSLSAGYVATLFAIYNQGLLRGNRNIMLTFDGQDGMESCRDCQRLKGARHKASWWIDNHLIPGQGGNDRYECKGWQCLHYLRTDDGERYTEMAR